MYIECVFLRELKNRFLCEVNVEGRIRTCYVPSSCRLSNFGNFCGKKALITECKSKSGRTEYSLYAIMVNRTYTLMDLKETNNIFFRNIHRNVFNSIGCRRGIIREKRFNDYRADFYIPDTSTIIEVKSVITTEKSQTIKQVYSDRAIRQLESIYRLLNDGLRVVYCFVAMNPRTEEIVITGNTEMSSLMKRNMNYGMVVKAYSIKRIKGEYEIYREIKIHMA